MLHVFFERLPRLDDVPPTLVEDDLARLFLKVPSRSPPRLVHHLGKVVPFDLDRVLDLDAKLSQDEFVQVLEVRDKQRVQRRVHLADEFGPLSAIHRRVVPTRVAVVHLEGGGDRRAHVRAEGRVDLARARAARGGWERGEAGREELERLGRDLAAAELGEQFLLRRQVEVLVRDDRVLFCPCIVKRQPLSVDRTACRHRLWEGERTQMVRIYVLIPSAGIRL